jgi:Phosphorylated adapter RNA export protein, RNA-binding domain
MDALTVEKLAEILQEPKVPLLRQVLRTLGQDRCAAILADTLACEACGGMRTKDGTRRRTPGGVFFQLVKERVTPKERQRLFDRPRPGQPQPPVPAPSPAQPQPPTWEEVRALVQTLPQGEATVKLTLIGRRSRRSRPGPRMSRFGCRGKRLARCPKAYLRSPTSSRLPGWSSLRCASGTGCRTAWQPMPMIRSLLKGIRWWRAMGHMCCWRRPARVKCSSGRRSRPRARTRRRRHPEVPGPTRPPCASRGRRKSRRSKGVAWSPPPSR